MSDKPRLLRRTEFGNPILRTPARALSRDEITSQQVQALIRNMYFTLTTKKYGVGLAAPQVGKGLSISVIKIQATKDKPEVEEFQQTIINPSFSPIGRRTQLWEGCLSFAGAKDTVFAKALRYRKIQARWQDELGVHHEEILSGLPAHVFQHETDHLNGVLFVDRVKDPTTWMNAREYRKRVVLPAMKARLAKRRGVSKRTQAAR